MKSNSLAWLSGLAGIGMIAVGIYAYRKQASQVAGLGWGGRHKRYIGRAEEAPVVGGVSKGGMRTTMREHPRMPIEMRVASIQRMVAESVQDPEVIMLGRQITRGCPERDGLCEARAVYDWVKGHVRYGGDIAPIKWPDGKVEGVDLFATARRVIQSGNSDCDEHSTVVATLLAVNGITPMLKVVAEKGADDYSHIYPVALMPKGTGNKPVALDTTLPGSNNFGVEAPHYRSVLFDA